MYANRILAYIDSAKKDYDRALSQSPCSSFNYPYDHKTHFEVSIIENSLFCYRPAQYLNVL